MQNFYQKKSNQITRCKKLRGFYICQLMTEDKTYFIADRIKSGDATAFRGLFRMHYPSLLAFVEGFVKDKEVAEDIVQNVFMKVWIYRSSLDVAKPLRGYLFLLCKREVCNWFRKEVTVQRFMSGLGREEIDRLAASESPDPLEMDELKKIADKTIDQMPAKRREVFVLSRREGLKIEEIAERLGISPRTVNKHMQLALRSLRMNLNKEQL